MIDRDPFEKLSRSFVGTPYEVLDPDTEVTPDQQRTFRVRCEDLLPQLDLDSRIISSDEAEEIGLDEDDIVELTDLKASAEFSVFGARVYIDASEKLTRPEKELRLSIYTASLRNGPYELRRKRQWGVIYNNETEESVPSYEENDEVYDSDTEERIRIHSPQSGIVRLFEELAKRELEWAAGTYVFTQERWAQAMFLLDIVGTLKEEGLGFIDRFDDE